MGFLNVFERKSNGEKILKDKELVLDVLSESLKGQKICPLLSHGINKPQKCIGNFCEFFASYKTRDGGEYSRCSFNQVPSLHLELLAEVRMLRDSLVGIAKEAAKDIKGGKHGNK